jgi:hypothetical protein
MLLVILQDMNTGQEESFPCEHGTLVVMNQLASGAAEQKYQHAITNSSGNLILVIEVYLLPGKSLKDTLALIMNEFSSAKGRRDVVGVLEPFLLKDPSKATIASAFSSNSDHAIAARGAVNWAKEENQLGYQLAITECGGIENLKKANVPTDETLFIAFLKKCKLQETLSQKTLLRKMQVTRLENGYIISVNWNKKENQLGLQLAFTECGGIEHLKTANVPTDEKLFIVFLKRCKLSWTAHDI